MYYYNTIEKQECNAFGGIMDRKDFYSRVFSLVLPIAFQQFMLAVVSATDALMLGMLSQDAMAAVSLAAQVQFVFQLYAASMTTGTNIFAAQYWGKQDIVMVERILAMILLFTIPVSLGFTVAAAWIPERIMGIFTPDLLLIANGARYLRWVSLSYLLCGISQIFLAAMKNCGGAIRSSVISSVCVVINIFLNAVLIFGLLGFPRMGIAGAALATVLARLVELVWTVLETLPRGRIKFRLTYALHLHKRLCHDFWKYVSPVLGNHFVWGIGFTMGSVILGHLGAEAVAANAIASVAKNLLTCFGMGVESAGGILVGNALGAGKLEEARRTADQVVMLSLLCGILTGLILLLLSPVILHFANLTSQAMEYLKWMIVICSVYCIGKSLNGTVNGGIFSAGGDAKFGFLCDAVTLWVVVVPLGLMAAFVWRLPVIAVYCIVNMDEIIKIPAMYSHYKTYKWAKDLTIEE